MRTLMAILYVALPKLIAGGGQFALNLMLIRYFKPLDFGALSVCLTALLLLDSFLGSAVDMAVLRLASMYSSRSEMDESYRIQKAGLLLKPLAIVLTSIPVLAFSANISELLFQGREFAYLITLTMLALATILFLRSVQTFFQIEQRFHWYGGTDLAHNALRYGFVAYALYTGFATPGLVLASYAVAPLIIGTTMLVGPARAMLSIGTSWASALRLGSVLAWFVPAAAVGGLTSRMDVFFVSHLSGVGQAGVFTAAQAVALPVLLLGTYLSVVFGPRIMPQIDNGSFAPFYRKFQLVVLGISISSYALLLSLPVQLTAAVFPPRFQQSWQILLVLFPSILAAFTSFPLTISLLLFLKPRFLFFVDACAIPLLCAAYYLVARKYGALGVAGLTTTYSLVKLVILQIAAWQLLKRKDQAHVRDVCQEVGLSRG